MCVLCTVAESPARGCTVVTSFARLPHGLRERSDSGESFFFVVGLLWESHQAFAALPSHCEHSHLNLFWTAVNVLQDDNAQSVSIHVFDPIHSVRVRP